MLTYKFPLSLRCKLFSSAGIISPLPHSDTPSSLVSHLAAAPFLTVTLSLPRVCLLLLCMTLNLPSPMCFLWFANLNSLSMLSATNSKTNVWTALGGFIFLLCCPRRTPFDQKILIQRLKFHKSSAVIKMIYILHHLSPLMEKLLAAAAFSCAELSEPCWIGTSLTKTILRPLSRWLWLLTPLGLYHDWYSLLSNSEAVFSPGPAIIFLAQYEA